MSVSSSGSVYLWGGRTDDLSQVKKKVASTLHTFDAYLETWNKGEEVTGPSPAGLYFNANACAGHHMYLYGGYDGARNNGTLHQLDLETHTWTELKNGPKILTGPMMIWSEDKLLLFGGYGPPDSTQQVAEPKKKYYRSNDLHVFDLKEGESQS